MVEEAHPLGSLLLVDDDDVDRLMVKRALRELRPSMRVVEATTAPEAERMATAHEFDCVLLDFRLPGSDGLVLLHRLRALGVSAPVIMMTGQGDEELAVQIMKAGAADYISKAAFTGERLVRSIVGALRLRDAERSASDARHKLEQAEQRYRFLAEAIPQMVWVIADDGTAEYVNSRWAEYTGMDAAATSGTGWESVVHPSDLELARASWVRARSGPAPMEAQLRLRRRSDGTYRWHLCRGMPFEHSGGRLSWFGTTTDIEDQKAIEAQLKQLASDAERSRRAAEDANRAKDHFLAMLSHELRTPMHSILGWASYLQRADTDEPTRRRAICAIDRNARTQTQLIEDLLDVSRIVTGKLCIEQRAVDLVSALQSAVEIVRPAAEMKSVELHVQIPDEPFVTMGDAARLQQIAWNLLSNAVKFTPADGRVSVRLTRSAERALFVIEDNGEGIAPAFLPFVFDRFQQAESASRAGGGLGLGLAIVRTLVEMHGGDVSAASPGPGLGATFSVSLPLYDAACLSVYRGEVHAPTSLTFAGLRALVVDDNDDAREMLAFALSAHEIEVATAESAAAALTWLERNTPDIIVSDIGMPGQDGYSFLTELRARPPASGGYIPAIALTGYAGLDDERRAREAGFDHHISKPVDIPTLLKAILRFSRNAGALQSKPARLPD